jgi:putative transposase
MPRPKRITPGGYCYHVLSRGNGRQRVFRKPADYEAFLGLFDEAQATRPMRVVGYCLMPNHFHLVLWPEADGDLSRWMQWILSTHVRRYHEQFRSSGHVWQGRFKAFPIQEDAHLLTVLRYMERNPLRAKLVKSAAKWQWSSLGRNRIGSRPKWLSPGPVPRRRSWAEYVDRPQTAAELKLVRNSVLRGTPFGDADWSQATVAALELESTVRPRGRPRLNEKEG